MTTEEKAKAYDKALERANIIYTGKYKPEIAEWTKKSLEAIFPELQESDDERIRKEIIKLVKFYYGSSLVCKHTISKDEMIAWLEKQGKKECALKSSKDEDVRKFMQYIEKEAKAYEFNLPNRGYDIYAFAKDILAWLEKQGKQKPKWNEEDEKNLCGIIDEIEANKSNAPDYDIVIYDRFLSWLESLKQRIEQ